MNDLGAWLKEQRLAQGLSQDEFARRAGLRVSTYVKYELNLRKPGWDNAQKIADVLELEHLGPKRPPRYLKYPEL
jgi:transcriptional regulator with XRE-family HTH domain